MEDDYMRLMMDGVEDMMKHPKIYHYTSLDTLLAIFHECKMKGGRYLTLRASNIYKVNDPSEMKRGYDVVKKILPGIEKKASINWGLCEVYTDKKYEEACKKGYYNEENKDVVTIGSIPYEISFSMRRDYLPMWSLYGDNGKGVCLRLDKKDIVDWLNLNNGSQCGGDVRYSNFGNDNLLKNIIGFGYSRINEIKDIYDKIRELATLCAYVAPFIKYKDYSYEKEFRVALYKQYGVITEPSTREKWIRCATKGYIKVDPYVELDFPTSFLKEIIVGPCVNSDVIIPILKRELKNCNAETIALTKSKVPFNNNK